MRGRSTYRVMRDIDFSFSISLQFGRPYLGHQRSGRSRMFRHRLAVMVAALWIAGITGAFAQDQGNQPAGCSLSPTVVSNVLGQLASVVHLSNGGLFSPNRMWAAVVDRQGVLCGVTRSDPDAWPGSRDIAIAKAFTANAFSRQTLAL